METDGIIRSDPAIMGGEPVFRGTRVPVAVVFENLADGLSLKEILESYPTLDEADVKAVLLRTPAILAPRAAYVPAAARASITSR